jgi:hypothetical protein
MKPQNISQNFSNLKHWHAIEYVLLIILLGLAILQSYYGFFSWSDPVDNVFGGQLILRGVFPYVGFFSHHMPFPYFLSALFSFFCHSHLEVYRLLFTLSLFAILLWFISWARKHVGRVGAWSGGTLIVLTLGNTLMNVPLAETIVSYLVLILFSLYTFRFLSSSYHIGRSDVGVVSVLLFLVVMSSLAYVFFAFAMGALFIMTSISKKRSQKIKHAFFVTSTLLAPYLVLLVVLFGLGKLGIFIEQAYTFNQVYYAQFAHEATTVIGWLSQPINSFLHSHIAALNSHNGASVFAIFSLSTIVIAIVINIVRKQYSHLALIFIAVFFLLPKIQSLLPFGDSNGVFHSGPFIFFLPLSAP